MGLFRKAGEKFEQTKQSFVDGDGDGADYVCRSCGEDVTEQYEYCPHCGQQRVDAVD